MHNDVLREPPPHIGRVTAPDFNHPSVSNVLLGVKAPSSVGNSPLLKTTWT